MNARMIDDIGKRKFGGPPAGRHQRFTSMISEPVEPAPLFFRAAVSAWRMTFSVITDLPAHEHAAMAMAMPAS